MKKFFVIMLSLLMLATTLVACDEHPDGNMYASELVWVNYGGSDTFYFGSLNRDKLSTNSVKHLPLYKMDSLSELEQFKANFAGDFQFEQSHGEYESFETATADINEEYFDTYSLFIIYVSANSSSYKYGIEKAIVEGENYNIYVHQSNNPEIVSDDMAGWFILLTTPKSQIDGCTVFDAQMVS